MIKTNAMRMLDKAKLSYETHEYENNGFTDGVTIAAKMGMDEKKVFKTLVTCAPSKNFYVFVIPVAKELNLKACAAAVGEKSVEMIHVKDITKITGYIRGGCSPIGMKKQFRTVMDESCLELETMVFSAGKIGYQIEMNPKDLIGLIGALTGKITF